MHYINFKLKYEPDLELNWAWNLVWTWTYEVKSGLKCKRESKFALEFDSETLCEIEWKLVPLSRQSAEWV